jgi:hypothetical protein
MQMSDADVSVTLTNRSDPGTSRTVEALVEETQSPGIRRAVASLNTADLHPGEYVVRARIRQKDQSAVLEQMLVLHAGRPSSDTAPPSAREMRGALPEIIVRACAYVDVYLGKLSHVVMDESYQQHARVPGISAPSIPVRLRFGSSSPKCYSRGCRSSRTNRIQRRPDCRRPDGAQP